MTSFLQLILTIAVIIFCAKLGGYISYRLGQPSVLGELLIGILIGPSLLDIFHLPYFNDPHLLETIHQFAEIGVLLLMFLAGLDLHVSELTNTGKIAMFSGVLGVLIPLGLGYWVGLVFGMERLQALFLGLILAATSVSISAQTLIELGVLRSRVGLALLGAAVFDDVLVVLGLSTFVASTQTDVIGLKTILLVIGKMILFIIIWGLLGYFTIPKLSKFVDRLPISRGLVAFTFVIALLYAWAAESFGSMAAITGAFLAGLLFARSQLKERIETSISSIAYAVFIPIFFVDIGLSTNAGDLIGISLMFLTILILVAIFGKWMGAGLGARLAGMTNLESIQLGAGMISRGEVGLIVASVGITEGWISNEIFTAVVGVIIITTLITPPVLRFLFKSNLQNNKTEITSAEGVAK